MSTNTVNGLTACKSITNNVNNMEMYYLMLYGKLVYNLTYYLNICCLIDSLILEQ